MRNGTAHERNLVEQLTLAYREADKASESSAVFSDVLTTSMEQLEKAWRSLRSSPLEAASASEKATENLKSADGHKQTAAESGKALVSALRAGDIGAIALARSAATEYSAAVDDRSIVADIPQRANTQAGSIEETADKASRATDIFHGSKIGTFEEAAGLFNTVAEEILGHATVAKAIADDADQYVATWQ